MRPKTPGSTEDEDEDLISHGYQQTGGVNLYSIILSHLM